MDLNLVGLYGASRSGKDTVAGVLVRHHGFEQRNMASPIRQILLDINPSVVWEDEEAGNLRKVSLVSVVTEWGWDVVKARFPETIEMMISLGQSMRDIDPGIWLNACVSRPFTNLVIADVRQPNEAQFITDHGGELWKVEREGSQVRGMDGILDDWDFAATINNNGTIEELEKIVREIMEARK